MISDMTMQDKMLTAAIIRNVSSYLKQPRQLFDFCLQGRSRFTVIMFNRCDFALRMLELSDEMIKNAQMTREVWDNMSLKSKEEYYHLIYEIICNPLQDGLSEDEKSVAFHMYSTFLEFMKRDLGLNTYPFMDTQLDAIRGKSNRNII